MGSDVISTFNSPSAPYYQTPRTFAFGSTPSDPSQYSDQATLLPSSPSLATSPSSLLARIGIEVSGTCKLPTTPGTGTEQACNAVLQLDTQTLEHHLRTCHSMPYNVNLSRNRNRGDQVLCPDGTCHCRFRTKQCTQWDVDGDRIQHRTHVYNYLRHYKDVHLRPTSGKVPARQKCDCCGKKFSRSESVARHKKQGVCGKVRFIVHV
jgi:hypothetical protein